MQTINSPSVDLKSCSSVVLLLALDFDLFVPEEDLVTARDLCCFDSLFSAAESGLDAV